MHSSQQSPAAVHHYQIQEQAVAPVYHRPTPSPQKRRQDTLTQNDSGARPIPSGWSEHTDGSGGKFYVHRKTKRFAPTYEHMFVGEDEPTELEPSKHLTQRSSSSSSANSQEEESPKKKSRRKPKRVIEVETQDLPGSDYSLDFAKRREAAVEVDKENDSKSANEIEEKDEDDEDDNEGNHNEPDEDESTQW